MRAKGLANGLAVVLQGDMRKGALESPEIGQGYRDSRADNPKLVATVTGSRSAFDL